MGYRDNSTIEHWACNSENLGSNLGHNGFPLWVWAPHINTNSLWGRALLLAHLWHSMLCYNWYADKYLTRQLHITMEYAHNKEMCWPTKIHILVATEDFHFCNGNFVLTAAFIIPASIWEGLYNITFIAPVLFSEGLHWELCCSAGCSFSLV